MYTSTLLVLSLLGAASLAFASDPDSVFDFCVADLNNSVLVNGFVCKDPKIANADDFFFTGLSKSDDPSGPLGLAAAPVGVSQIPGLNTLGLSLVRFDFALDGQNPPHTHPRASEILTVLEGSILVGFVTSFPDNRLISKVLQKGDVFVIPLGLVHFQMNVGKSSAAAIAALNSQNPGLIPVANTVFGSNPPISSDVLAKSFQVESKIIDLIKSKT
ncbi:germin-like protein 8-2 [Aristolochia californica]|uniref:germin-like protein 8-2 n=1 Tax=Aristolochia californica TaxID=171875 RepID=UPI0035D9FE1F